MQRRIPTDFVNVVGKVTYPVTRKIECVGNLLLSVESRFDGKLPSVVRGVPACHAIDIEFGNAADGACRV